MFEYLEQLRLKPGHIRERIAFGVAAGTTGLVALGWIAVTATSNIFVLNPSPTVTQTNDGQDIGSVLARTKDGVTSLLGAAGATQLPEQGITVETSASTTMDTPTVLPF